MSERDRAKWNARYRDGVYEDAAPAAWLVANAAHLAETGRALDVAGGAGRNAVWLAARGFDVTLTDVADEALVIARRRANAAGVSIETARVDCETEPLPSGPWDVVTCCYYLHRPLFEQWPRLLAPGGVLVFVQPTVRNLERHSRPPRQFLLAEGELASLVSGLDVVEQQEEWSTKGHHEARLVARRSD